MEKQIDYTDYRQKIIDSLESLKTVFNIPYEIYAERNSVTELNGKEAVGFVLKIILGEDNRKRGVWIRDARIRLEDYTNDSAFYKLQYIELMRWLYLGTTYTFDSANGVNIIYYSIRDLIAEYTKDKFLKESLNGKQ